MIAHSCVHVQLRSCGDGIVVVVVGLWVIRAGRIRVGALRNGVGKHHRGLIRRRSTRGVGTCRARPTIVAGAPSDRYPPAWEEYQQHQERWNCLNSNKEDNTVGAAPLHYGDNQKDHCVCQEATATHDSHTKHLLLLLTCSLAKIVWKYRED